MGRKGQPRTDPDEWGDQLTIPGTAQRRKVGRAERSLNSSVAHARRAGFLSDFDNGAVGVARALARTVDWCESNGESHTLTLAAGRLSDLLTKLRLEPSSRGVTDSDGFDRLLEDLGTPTFGDAEKP
jgi:hypothetical protein